MPAAGFGVTAHGLSQARKGLQERAKRVRDLTPVMKLVGQDLENETVKAIRNSRSPKGEPFADIKEATKLGRAGVRKRLSKRTKKGGLTAGAKKFRAALLATGGARPLDDTGRMKNSRQTRATKRSVRFSMVGYTGPHITGDKAGKLPKRNPTPFEFVGGRWVLVPRLRQRYARMILQHVEARR